MERSEIENLASTKFQSAGAVIPAPVVSVAKELGLTVSEINMPQYEGITPSGILTQIDGKWTILLKVDDSPTRKRFTIAHEIGHFLIHSSISTFILDDFPAGETFYRDGLDNDKEKEANYFAACLLMPSGEVNRLWQSGEFKNPGEMANKFNVSEVSMTYRLKNLGLIA